MYYVYVLHSQSDHQLYTGFTSDLKRRFQEHNSGKVISTKNRKPLRLIYYEAYLSKADAQGREVFLKSGRGKMYIKKQLKHHFEISQWEDLKV